MNLSFYCGWKKKKVVHKIKNTQLWLQANAIWPDEVISVLEDSSLPVDGVLRKRHSSKVDQQHGGELALPPAGSLLLLQGVCQGEQQQDPGEDSPGAFTQPQRGSRRGLGSEKSTIEKSLSCF